MSTVTMAVAVPMTLLGRNKVDHDPATSPVSLQLRFLTELASIAAKNMTPAQLVTFVQLNERLCNQPQLLRYVHELLVYGPAPIWPPTSSNGHAPP